MKRIKKYLIIGLSALSLSSCNDWLTVYPENEQVTDNYWTSKEDVKSVLASGYYYMRECVPSLINWGELRAGSIYARKTNNMQVYQILPTDKTYVNWSGLYQVINMANLVLAHTDAVLDKDNTMVKSEAESFKAEAYFLRALAYFYIVRNWRDAPLILTPYEDDATSYNIAKSSEAEIIAQIKSDLTTAINSGAAKEGFDEDWETKGKATIWAIYALLADVDLWSEDYQGALDAANNILNSESSIAPKFMWGTLDGTKWFNIYNPGNSNESILELQYDYSSSQTNTLATVSFGNSDPLYIYSSQMSADIASEVLNIGYEAAIRATSLEYMTNSASTIEVSDYVWKYTVGESGTTSSRSSTDVPNFPIYRVTDVKLMKAEALTRLGAENYEEACAEISDVRTRVGLDSMYYTSGITEQDLLEEVLEQRNLEFAAEGKRWYDLLRFGRSVNFKYREQFITLVTKYNATANPSWIRSVLSNDDALFLPILQSEIDNNPLLVQNPYYE